MNMRGRPFAILAVALVAINVFFWLASPGLALRKAVINQLFGQRMIRAEVVLSGTGTNPTDDFRIDRGVVIAATASTLTLREADGTVQAIPVASSTRLQGAGKRLGLAVLARRGAHVLVVRPANGAATSVQVESAFHRGELP